jgi:hypothetical protein
MIADNSDQCYVDRENNFFENYTYNQMLIRIVLDRMADPDQLVFFSCWSIIILIINQRNI